MTYIYLLIIGFLVNKFGTTITIQLAKKQQLFEPTDHRKIHTERISALGGLPIFIALWSIAFMTIIPSIKLGILFIATAILFTIGLWDDLKNIDIKKRLIAQLMAANLAYIAGFHLGLPIALFDYVFSISFIILMINGTNFIDGINGLAGSLGVLCFGFLGFLCYQIEMPNLMLFSLIYASILLGFLAHNFGNKAAIFMGDNGSTVMGFVIAILGLKVIEIAPSSSNFMMNALSIISLVALPILDLLAVVVLRLCKGKSPFKADRIHLHHLLTDMGKSHPESCQLIIGWILSLLMIFHYQLITTLPIGLTIIIGSYIFIRLYFSPFKVRLISVVKWDKPVPPPPPTPELNFE